MPRWQLLEELTPMNVLWGLHQQCPCPHSEPQLTPTSPEDPPRSAGMSGPGSYGVTRSQCTQNPVCASKSGVSVSSVAPALKPFWPSKLNALGLLLPVPGPQAEEPDVGLRTLTPVGKLLQ